VRCAGCNRELKDGDLIIEDSVSGFAGVTPNADVDDLVAEILSGGKAILLCAECTQRGGKYQYKVYRDERREP